jgi:hypothetical protein
MTADDVAQISGRVDAETLARGDEVGQNCLRSSAVVAYKEGPVLRPTMTPRNLRSARGQFDASLRSKNRLDL